MIDIKALTKIYPGGVCALDNVSLTVTSGDFISIIGHSGSGKSTLMNIIGCLDRQSSGSYRINGKEVSELTAHQRAKLRNTMIGFIFQGFNLSPRMTAFENVELPLLFRGMSRSKRKELVMTALKRVGLENRAKHFPSQLSGGQQQRVAIARAIAACPPVILADEPTGSLDKMSANECISLLRELNAQGHTLIMITHDTDLTKGSSRIFRLDDGKLFAV